ncbi:MAG: SLC13 family permease [Myxococcota bacterium]
MRRPQALSLLAAFGLLLAGPAGFWSSLFGLSEPAGMTLSVLAVAGLLWTTEALPLFVTSFLVLFLNLALLSPTLPQIEDERFIAPFFSNVILLFLGGFVLSAALQKHGLGRRIALLVLARTGPRPDRVLAGFMGTTALLSMWMSNTATTAMMLGLAAPILAELDEDEPFQTGLLLGVAFAANLGGLGTPIGTPANAIAMQYMAQAGFGISFLGWLGMALPMLVVLIVFAWWTLARSYPPKAKDLALGLEGREMSRQAPLVASTAILTILGWLTGGLHGLSSGTIALIPILVLFGSRALETSDFRGLPWDVLMLAGGGLSLGVAVSASGLAEAIVGLVPTKASGFAVAASFAVLACGISTFMSNTATANLLIPVALGLPPSMVKSVLVAVAMACSVSMTLPVTTPPNAMAFASGRLEVRDMIRLGGVLSVLGVGGILLSALAWRTLGLP